MSLPYKQALAWANRFYLAHRREFEEPQCAQQYYEKLPDKTVIASQPNAGLGKPMKQPRRINWTQRGRSSN